MKTQESIVPQRLTRSMVDFELSVSNCIWRSEHWLTDKTHTSPPILLVFEAWPGPCSFLLQKLSLPTWNWFYIRILSLYSCACLHCLFLWLLYIFYLKIFMPCDFKMNMFSKPNVSTSLITFIYEVHGYHSMNFDTIKRNHIGTSCILVIYRHNKKLPEYY